VSVEGWACPNCGATKGFSQNVEVTMDAYREVTLVRGDDGKLTFKFGWVDTSYATVSDHDITSRDDVKCECGAEFRNGVEDLRWVWPDYRPGDAVVLPDGLRGFVEWFRDGLIAIRGWHERFKPHEVYSPVPITRSEPLIPDGS
jgi:hypothetical protein